MMWDTRCQCLLIKAKDHLALLTTIDPPENMHCAVIYQILGKDSTNIFKACQSLSAKRKSFLRPFLAQMAHHFDQIGKPTCS